MSIQPGYIVAARVHSLLQTARLIFQGGDFCFVGPSEDKSCAVIQAIAVIFFMSLAARLDLARLRESTVLAPELF